MEEKMKEPTDIEPIDYRVHETALARLERVNRRWFILCIIVFLAFVISNGIWIYYENQFEDTVTISQDVDTAESPAYVNGTGSMTVNGKDQTDNHKNP